jgi:hypothetical protein
MIRDRHAPVTIEDLDSRVNTLQRCKVGKVLAEGLAEKINAPGSFRIGQRHSNDGEVISGKVSGPNGKSMHHFRTGTS